MGKGRRPDPRKRKIAHAHSTYIEVPNKTKAGGWKAGEVYGLYCHHAGHTKPCVDDVTNGGLACKLCEAGFDLVFRCYLPLWDREYQLRHCLIGEDFFEAVDRIPFRHPLTLSRTASMRSPLKVSDEPLFVRMLPDGPPWDKPVDMLSICLTLWKDEVLARWMMIDKTPTVSDDPQALTKSDGTPFSPMYVAAALRYGTPTTPGEPATVDEPVKRLLKHVAATTGNGNGNGKPKKGGA